MAAALAEPGGPAAHFERLYPWLLVPVWRAESGLGGSGGAGGGGSVPVASSPPLTATVRSAAPSAPAPAPPAPAPPAPAGSGAGHAVAAAVAAPEGPLSVSVGLWLTSVNPALAVYAEAMAEYGFENTGLLRDADEETVADCFAEVSMKKPHQAAARRAVAALRQ